MLHFVFLLLFHLLVYSVLTFWTVLFGVYFSVGSLQFSFLLFFNYFSYFFCLSPNPRSLTKSRMKLSNCSTMRDKLRNDISKVQTHTQKIEMGSVQTDCEGKSNSASNFLFLFFLFFLLLAS